MAILIIGKSLCPICGHVINSQDDAIAMPAFLKSTHRLAMFSDATLHRWCFERCPERDDVERLLSRYKVIIANAPTTTTLDEYESWLKEALREFQ